MKDMDVQSSKSEKIDMDINNKNSEEVISFFIVPTWRLVIFSILSYGFYSVYWFARNFNAIEKRKKKRGEKIYSTAWGFLNILSSEILFKELSLIKKETTGEGLKIQPAILGVMYFVFMVAARYVFLVPFVFIYTALTFQKNVKKYQSNPLVVYKQAKFNWKELAIVLIGILLLVIFNI
ncbi:MAG: hypothetical protein ACOYMB_00195 [Patescibacteria group bacterium]